MDESTRLDESTSCLNALNHSSRFPSDPEYSEKQHKQCAAEGVAPKLKASHHRRRKRKLSKTLNDFIDLARLDTSAAGNESEFLQDVGGENLQNFYRPKEYVGFVTKMMIGFGIGFEFPIVLIFLQLLGIVDNRMLRAGRRYAIVGIVALVAVLTPSGDPLSLMALSIPMYLFYEFAIVFGWWRARKKAKADAAGS